MSSPPRERLALGRAPSACASSLMRRVLCRRALPISVGLLLPLVSAAAGAPTPTPTSASNLSLSQAIDAAWLRAAEARTVEALGHHARAAREAASHPLAAAPALELSHRRQDWAGSGNGTESEIGVALPLWLPGQRQSRLDALDVEDRLARASGESARLQVAGKVLEGAWQVAAGEDGRRLHADQVALLARLVRDVARRVAAGDLAPADSLAAQAEWLEAQDTLAAAALTLAEARSRWRELTGLDASPDRLEDETNGDASTGDASTDDAHPDQVVADLAAEHARRRVVALDHDRRDPPELLVRLRQDTGNGFGRAQDSVGFGLRIPLGHDARNAPRQAAAATALDLALAAAVRTRDRLAVARQLAGDTVHAASARLGAARTRATLLQERARLIQRSFDAGETPLPDLLRALSASAQAGLLVARRQADLGLARARLQHAHGVQP